MAKKVPTFENDEQRRDSIIGSLQQLKETYGWKVIQKAMEEDIRQIEKKLHGDEPLDSDETITQLQDRRTDRIGLRDIIDNLIEQYGDVDAFPVELDPYQ